MNSFIPSHQTSLPSSEAFQTPQTLLDHAKASDLNEPSFLDFLTRYYHTFGSHEQALWKLHTWADWVQIARSHWQYATAHTQGHILIQFDPRLRCIYIVCSDESYIVECVQTVLARLKIQVSFFLHQGAMNESLHSSHVTHAQAKALICFQCQSLGDTDIETCIIQLREAIEAVHRFNQSIPLIESHLDEAIQALSSCVTSRAQPDYHASIDFLKWLRSSNAVWLHSSFDPAPTTETTSSSASSKPLLRISKSPKRVTSPFNVYPTVLVAHIDQRLFQLTFFWMSSSYYNNPRQIPLLNYKIDQVVRAMSVPKKGYAERRIYAILEALPRSELLCANIEDLIRMVTLAHQRSDRLGLQIVMRNDSISQLTSLIIYVPFDLAHSQFARAMQNCLTSLYPEAKEIQHTIFQGAFSHVHLVIRPMMDIDIQALNDVLMQKAWPWTYRLQHLLEQSHPGITDVIFPASYQELYSPARAIDDLTIGLALTDQCINIRMEADTSHASSVHLCIFRRQEAIGLSAISPILESLGFQMMAASYHHIQTSNGLIWMGDFWVTSPMDRSVVMSRVSWFQKAIEDIEALKYEHDHFQKLILYAGIDPDEIVIIRACAKYLKQLGVSYSQHYIQQTCLRYPELMLHLIRYFKEKFDPRLDHREMETPLKQFYHLMADVHSSDEDDILRKICGVFQGMARTNYYQPNRQALIFKLYAPMLPFASESTPLYEMFVYNPVFEAVHLRKSSKVARGGLRWSDRTEDFRTEIMDLMNTQEVKNALIVPSGAKGGFVLKRSFDDLQKAGMLAYDCMIHAFISITDHYADHQVIHPDHTICYDPDDYYLVVAADKGTAKCSDRANKIAQSHGFWLGDAFASGGSAGYDHKSMGITARGVWVCVERHLTELGLPLEGSTLVGIGDMSGDLFGNGLLLHRGLRLVAAFNHRHIFLDPDPDLDISYEERKRLFQLPTSSWKDYRLECLSDGGAIIDRSDKSVTLHPRMQMRLGIQQTHISTQELIQAILKAPVDIVWNGGIGTYIKASSESHSQAQDPINDSVRVNACDMRAKILAEGGNLGITPLGRIEYAQNKGSINADFIDNAGGVNCSDREVNIKILLGLHPDFSRSCNKESHQKRETLLASMTDDVREAVLLDIMQQSRAITCMQKHSISDHDLFVRFIQDHYTDFQHPHYIPHQIWQSHTGASAHQALSKPELSWILSKTKIQIKKALLETSVLDHSYIQDFLARAFPPALRTLCADVLAQHPLKRELIAKELTNHMVDHMGAAFVYRLRCEVGASVSSITLAYVLAMRLLDFEATLSALQIYEQKSSHIDIFHAMYVRLVRLVRRATRWFLHHYRVHLNPEVLFETFKPWIDSFYTHASHWLCGSSLEHFEQLNQHYQQNGIEDQLAHRIALSRAMSSAFDILNQKIPYSEHILAQSAGIYFHLGHLLELDWIRESMADAPAYQSWDALAKAGFKDALDAHQKDLMTGVLAYAKHHAHLDSIESLMQQWMADHEACIQRWTSVLQSARHMRECHWTVFSVLIQELRYFSDTVLQSALIMEDHKT